MTAEKKRVFILDDDEGILLIARRILEQAGYEIRVSNHALGVSNDIKNYAPDVVLLDVMLPAIKGTKIADIILKTMDPKPVIILYSNKTADELRDLVAKSGADDFLCKTDGPQALLRKVRMHTL